MRKLPLLNQLTKSKGGQTAVIILSTLISMLTTIILCVVITFLALFKKSIHIYLKIKHGRNYGGILENMDNIWTLETNQSRHIINCLLFINFDIPAHEIIPTAKDIYLKKVISHLSWVRKSFMGYNFRLLNQVDVNDLFKELILTREERTNKELFENRISSLANVEISKGTCCEVSVSKEYVTFPSKKGLFPVLFRIHHSACDGTSLLSFLIKQVADEDLNIVEKYLGKMAHSEVAYNGNKEEQKYVLKNFLPLTKNYLKTLMKSAEKIKTNIYMFPLTQKKDINCLHTEEQLSGDKLLSFFVEENPEYVQKIKKIKGMVPGVTFNDVLLTLVSASLYHYFKEVSFIKMYVVNK